MQQRLFWNQRLKRVAGGLRRFLHILLKPLAGVVALPEAPSPYLKAPAAGSIGNLLK
jgi:hypothetical protein